MILVIDASAALALILDPNKNEEYSKEIKRADTVIAPELFVSEVANVAWKYKKLAGFTHEETLTLAENSIALVDQLIPVNEIWKESLREAINNDHPVYDFLYIICARRNDGMLLTKDKKLKNICKKLAVKCV